MLSNTRRRYAAVAGGLGLAFALAACMPADDTTDGGSDAGSGDGEVAAGCEDYAQYGDLKGTTVSVYTSIVDVEQTDQEESYNKFEECTGATIEYEGSREFEAQLLVRIQAGNELAPVVAGIKDQLPSDGSLVSLGKVYHRFA